MRLFTAIELPPAVRAHVAGVAEAMKQFWRAPAAAKWPAVSWTKESNLHVTLKFLGEVADERVPALCDALRTVRLDPPAPRLFVDGIDAFPSRGAARVLVAKLAGDVERLAALHADIEGRCASLGSERENRRYRPHVTLGRPRVPLRGAWSVLESAAAGGAFHGPEFDAPSFSLVHSRLNPAGAIYATVAAFPVSA